MACALGVDPYSPIGLASDGRRGQRQIRRASILAATRRSMSTRGYRHFNISDVAESCAVSIQTVYYNFGSKKDLLLTALTEYNIELHEFCYSRNPTPTVFLDIVEAYLECAKLFPNFMKEWLHCSYDTDASILRGLQERGQGVKRRIISDVSSCFCLVPGFKPSSIAYLLSKTNTSSLYDWVKDQDYGRLLEKMIEPTGEVIAGSFVDGGSLVESWKARKAALVA